MKMTHQKAKGFTLVELLVVIAIIAVLAALSTPVIMTALKKAKVATAKAVCVSLGNAVDRFESEYSYLPSSASSERSDGAFMAALAGVEAEGSSKMNFKDIKFFTLASPKGSSAANYKNGMDISSNSATAYDAWGEKYYILLDDDLDGMITGPEGKEVNGKLALVYSSGPEKVEPTSGMTTSEWNDIPTNFK